MPASPLRRLLLFGGIALVILIALSLLWSFVISAPYNRALVAAADPFTSADLMLGEDFDETTRQQLGLTEDRIYITVQTEDEIVLYGYLEGTSLQYGMLLVISLIAATPGLGWRRRCAFLPLAALIMFVLHLITIAIFAKLSLSGVELSRNPFVFLFVSLGTALFPTVIWGALSFRYWFPGPETAPQVQEQD